MDVPPGHLVPGADGRRQYVQWALGLCPLQCNNAIDVGSGPVTVMARLLCDLHADLCVYCTEIDPASLAHARQTSTTGRIRLHQAVEPADLLTSLMARDDVKRVAFDFVVCNPPFYDPSMRDGVHTRMTESEGFFPGGEMAFCRLLIDQSWRCRDRLRFATCLLGHKSSLHAIRRYCWERGAKQVATAVFCPGKTRRWAVAWTFHRQLRFSDPRPRARPLFVDADDADAVLSVMAELGIELRAEGGGRYAAHATSNTWSRRARRGGGGGGDRLETNINFTINIRPWGSRRCRVFFNLEGHEEQPLQGLVSHVRSKLTYLSSS